MRIFTDIDHSFIRQPIQIALSNYLHDSISFVGDENTADLVIGSSDKIYTKPCILLSDNPELLHTNNTCLTINPTPTNKSEMYTLVLKVAEYLGKL